VGVQRVAVETVCLTADGAVGEFAGAQDAKAREKEKWRVQELEAERTQHIPCDAKRHVAVDHVSHLLDGSSTAVAAVSAGAVATKRRNLPSVPKPAKKRPAPVGEAPAAPNRGSSGKPQKASGECMREPRAREGHALTVAKWPVWLYDPRMQL
jgi:hypothetical protein